MVLSEMPDVSLPRMRSSAFVICPRLSWIRNEWLAQWASFREDYGLAPDVVAGRPVCDIFTTSAAALMRLDALKTPEAWANGGDVSAALFDWRVLLAAGVDYLGVTSRTGGGHSTGLLIVQDDADKKDNLAKLYHYEPQTSRDCPLADSLARGIAPVELRD